MTSREESAAMGRAINAIVEPEDIPVVRLRPASPCVALAGFLGHAQLGIDQREFQTHQRAREASCRAPVWIGTRREKVRRYVPLAGIRQDNHNHSAVELRTACDRKRGMEGGARGRTRDDALGSR